MELGKWNKMENSETTLNSVDHETAVEKMRVYLLNMVLGPLDSHIVLKKNLDSDLTHYQTSNTL